MNAYEKNEPASPEIYADTDSLLLYGEIALKKRAWKNAISFVTAHPYEYVVHCLRRVVTFWSPYISFAKKYKIPWLTLLVTSIFSILILRHQWERLSLVYLLIGFYLGPVLFIAEPRYHLPTIPFLIIIVSFSFNYLFTVLYQKTRMPDMA